MNGSRNRKQPKGEKSMKREKKTEANRLEPFVPGPKSPSQLPMPSGPVIVHEGAGKTRKEART